MTDQMPAFIRTLMPFVVGYLATRFGLDSNDPLLSAGVGYAFYVIVHFVELHYPQFGWLLGVAKAPAYSTEPAPSPGPGEDVEAVVVPDEGAVEVGLLGIVLIIIVVVLLVR